MYSIIPPWDTHTGNETRLFIREITIHCTVLEQIPARAGIETIVSLVLDSQLKKPQKHQLLATDLV